MLHSLAVVACACGLLWAAFSVWGDELLAYYIQPAAPFDPTAAPRAPDYTDPRYWAAFPGKASAARLTPRGLPERRQSAPADVFYIHPTSYISAQQWNAPLFSDTRAWEMVDIMLGAQASAFNYCCDIYAPHYRQAALSSFLAHDSPDGAAALELAYADVARAFDAFLVHSDGRPFIIASHSQGTYHALRLMAERIDGGELQRRLVAAYLVGYWLPLDTFERTLPHIPPCDGAGDTGCVVHWSTYGEGGQRRNGVPHWYPDGPELADGKPLLCSNPLNWQRDGAREPASRHPGALYVPRGDSLLGTLLNVPSDIQLHTLPRPLKQWTWAECREGLLQVAEQVSGPFAELNSGPAKDYHLADYSLFYNAVRDNAALRTRQFDARMLSQH
ncbi:DUF3089 domain-containing protein [Parahaliea mediterranea]|uniref:DUF3089 domain-containing protein n=1 Tax=Parahaliea mediterranea TaxID=651086 RepID=UPI0013007131|nr:DUF3089 domain-containing protein [Parahaliea mediterranea]